MEENKGKSYDWCEIEEGVNTCREKELGETPGYLHKIDPKKLHKFFMCIQERFKVFSPAIIRAPMCFNVCYLIKSQLISENRFRYPEKEIEE